MATTATVNIQSEPSFIEHDDKHSTAFCPMDSDDSHFHDTVFSTIDTKNVNHAVGSTTITRSKSEQHDEMNTETLTVDDDSTCTPSSLSSYDSESNFDKPSRTFSEDTIITTLEKVNSQNETKSGPIVKAIATAVEKIPNREKDGQQRAPNTFMTELHSNVTKRTTLPKSLAVSSMNDVGNISDALTQGKKLIENDALEEVEADTMEDISLEEEVISSSIRKNSTTANKKHTTSKEAITNHLKEITSALVSGKKPDITVPAPAPTRLHTTTSVTETVQQQSPKEEDGNRSGNNKSIIAHDENENVLIASSGASTRTSSSATSTTSRSIFNFWSPFRSMSSSSSSTTTSPSSSRRPSKQYSAPVLSATTTTSRPTSSLSPLPEFQEALLAQMEQLNTANTNDPKSKVLRNLKRQSIKHSLVTQNKGDDYDWDFWAGFMCDYQNFNKVNKDIVKHIRFGIPPSIRGMVWQLLAGSKNEASVSDYIHLLKQTSPYDKMIQRDLARTFPGHTYFKDTDGQGQEGLYNVVRAYSLHDDKVGYCQGLAFIVGPMLLNMPDEDAFCLLIQLMEKYGLRGHFTPEMEGLQLRLYQFDALMQEHFPHIARHLKQQGINSTMYASQWFMTLFAYKFPLNLVFRIYDVIFTEGISSIFKFGLALLKRNQTTILGLDFEQLLNFLKDGLFEDYKTDDRRFVSDACELVIPAKKLSQLAKEYKQQLKKEQADANTMEEFQRLNLTLKKDLEDLETKTNETKREKEDVDIQLRETINELRSLQDEHTSLATLVSSLKDAINTLPRKIEAAATHHDEFEKLCNENAELTSKNSNLEDQLQKAEATLIDIKMQYAESENEREELHKRLFELKKIMSF